MAGVRLAWAVEAVIAGAQYRFATRALEVDGLTFHAGLEIGEQSRLADFRDRVPITITTSDRWGDYFRAASFLIDGGRCDLYLVIEEGGATRRELWRRGTVDRTRWDLPGRPLSFDLVPSATSYGMLLETHCIRPSTIPTDDVAHTPANVWEQYPETDGKWYQLIIGYPGAYDRTTIIPCVPAPVLQISYDTYDLDHPETEPPVRPEDLPEQLLILCAGYDVARRTPTGGTLQVELLELGQKVTLHGEDLNGDPTSWEQPLAQTSVPLEFGTDKLDQPFAFLHYSMGKQNRTGESEAYIGFGLGHGSGSGPGGERESGGGIKLNGRTLRGAADIFEWVVKHRTSFAFDEGRHRADADELNAYLFDTYVDAQVDALEWYEAAVLQFIPARIAMGPDGIYLCHMPVQPTGRSVEVHLVEGQHGTRESTPDVIPPTITAITVRWARARDTYHRQRTLGSEEGIGIPVPGGGVWRDPFSRRHFLATIASEVHGIRTMSLEVPTVWDAGTAERIAVDRLWMHALPQRPITMWLAPEWHHLRPGQQVRYTDEGLGIVEHVCRVDDVRLELTHVTVVLMPLKAPTHYL